MISQGISTNPFRPMVEILGLIKALKHMKDRKKDNNKPENIHMVLNSIEVGLSLTCSDLIHVQQRSEEQMDNGSRILGG